jgi:dynein heavy chain
VFEAKRKDMKLIQKKVEFASVTHDQVDQFKEHIKVLYNEYKASGPGAVETSLDRGLELLVEYKEIVGELNKKKDELVLAEKLFNLPISTFKELVAIEEENKKLTVLYDVYKSVKTAVGEWSTMLWAKLDAELLRVGADNFDKLKKKLGKAYDDNPVY